MKKILLSLTIGLSLLSCSPKPKEEAKVGILFQEDIEFAKALEQSKKEGKLLFVDCTSPNCGACIRLTKETFPDKSLGELFNSTYINVSYNVSTPLGKEVCEKYKVKAFPTLLFLDSNGEIIHKRLGYGTVKDFVELSKTATDTTQNFQSIYNKIKSGDRSFTTIKKYLDIDRYSDTKDVILNDYYTNIGENNYLTDEAIEIFNNYDYNINSKYFKYVLANKDAVGKKISADILESKMVNAFDEYCYINREKPNCIEDLKKIDPKIYSIVKESHNEREIFMNFYQNRKDKAAWDKLVAHMQKKFESNTLGSNELNSFAWTVWENYKTFNDSTALRFGLNWSKKSFEGDSLNSAIVDTYGHYLFDLGHNQEAVRIAQIAVDRGTIEKSEYLKFYEENLELYKKKL